MNIVIIIMLIACFVVCIIEWVTDAIHTHWLKEYIKVLEKQNELLKTNIKIDSKVLMEFKLFLKNLEDKTHE